MTTGQLRAELKALVLMFEPDAVRRRAERGPAERGRDQARVETWQETSGNWGMARRELAAADAITADKRITAIARALKDAGAEGDLDQLRATVLVALLTGRDPETLVPGESRPAGQPGLTPVAGLAGSINLTMPLSAWLGSSDTPGEVAGLGPVDAGTCRDLANRAGRVERPGPGAPARCHRRAGHDRAQPGRARSQDVQPGNRDSELAPGQPGRVLAARGCRVPGRRTTPATMSA